MAIKRNAIPILGKSISKTLYKKLLTANVKDIYLALDSDAKTKGLKIAEQLLNQGKKIYFLELFEKDPSEMGFESFTEYVQTAEELDFSTLMQYKLEI